MGKFRSKMKGQTKGKRWLKGQSSNSNPKTQKYREMAKSRFFQENLGNTGLTQQAVSKHDAIMTYGHSTGKEKSVAENELTIAKEFENMSVRSGDEETETQYSHGSMKSFKTFQTFASDWSQCSNISFNKLLNKFDSNNAVHKEMLAILAAVTEVIKEQGGKETTTEYFAALMETLKATEGEEGLTATLTLLSMGIKSVPQAVLRKQFSDSAAVFTDILEKYAQSENGTLLRGVIGCISILLREQEYAAWGDSSTMKVFDAVLAFTLHSKPKVRKAAQHAVTSILRGSCFMIPSEDKKVKVPKLHPASNRTSEFCLSVLSPGALLAGPRAALHTLAHCRDLLPAFSREHIKSHCEAILSLMTHNNVYVKTCCLHTLHALLSAPKESSNLCASAAVQLTRALLAARPPADDAAQVLAWAATVQQAYCCLAGLDLNLCLPNLPTFVSICVSELWQADVADINSASTNALKAVLLDCVKPALADPVVFSKHKQHIETVFKTVGTGLDNPFNQAVKHVVLTIAVCFEIGNEKVAYILGPLLKKLNERRESHNFHNNKEVEYATGCAIKSMGPEFVFTAIPIRSDPDAINLERSWLLPVMKEKITNANLKFFATEILELATFCRKKSRELAQENDMPGSHTYELLCNQFWALLPSFCNNPQDIKDNFKAMARVLGNVLKDNPEFRLSVMQGLRKLVSAAIDKEGQEDVAELARFAKNYLPILLNIYMSPAKGSSAEGQRLAALETIQVYLIISDQSLREELFRNSLQQLETSTDNHAQRESILDVLRLLVLYQSCEQITDLFDKWVFPLCATVLEDPKKFKKTKKEKAEQTEKIDEEDVQKTQMKFKEKARLLEMEHKKAYRILEEIFKSDKESCKQFLTENHKKIKKLLVSSLNKVADSSKAARLRCIELLINRTPTLNAESKLLKSAIAECIVCTRDINSKCRQCAYNLINTIGNVLKDQEGGMDAFVTMLLSGLDAPLPRIAAATLKALASALYTFSEQMGLPRVQGLLETVAEKITTNNRDLVNSGMSFLKVYTKVLPTEVLAGSLPLIFRSLSGMTDDCKRHARMEIGYFLSRMIRKYGADTVEKLIPATDEVMLKRLRNIRKMENRKKRQKEGQKEQQSDAEPDTPIRGSKTLEDILADSDSDLDYMEDEEPRPKKKGKTQAWIQDDPENIVDLADVSASRKITATNPQHKKKALEVQSQKKKDGGFRTAADGRLIIADDGDDDDDDDEPRPSGDVDSDTDDTDKEDNAPPSALLKPGSKRRFEDILSIKSGRSGRSRASTAAAPSYKAGGKGIHRPLGSAASVASTAGTDYRSKKAKGDVKKKGKHDPYAYLPLSRKNLNKRTKATNAQQFKGVVKSKNKRSNVKAGKRK
ncbi:RRP12-like protein [Plutella xylostella]|uniref:RRP12-like protein n=1 Tax=Plutella xylostella TaxID=51655 RepID=UPI002032A00B|nr:RRP12-like protein [Plutella xylostella]